MLQYYYFGIKLIFYVNVSTGPKAIFLRIYVLTASLKINKFLQNIFLRQKIMI